ncbi:MAG TPA: DHH family phosphoesterase [Verrucomicrobiae bacterium]|nr:DHH family phosphoesterase [Verrucomicrobiae bacterium]
MQDKIKQLVDEAQKIVILQADNPDADSLASALALEQLLGEMNKEVHLYGGVDMPGYLKYLKGWDRVSPELPHQFDLSIIVDASTMTLFGKLVESGQHKMLANKPCVVLDHHAETDNLVPFATVMHNKPELASTGQVIYELWKELGWPVDATAAAFIMTSILGDTQGLANDLTTASTYRVMADLVDLGVNRPQLEEERRDLSKMHPDIFRYKATLIERTELHADGRLALTTIPHDEIMEYSPLYNPNALIQNEHLLTQGVLVSVSMKSYADGRITAAIRCNTTAPIAGQLAEHFGGGGHEYSSGFKITGGKSLDDTKAEVVKTTMQLLDGLEQS